MAQVVTQRPSNRTDIVDMARVEALHPDPEKSSTRIDVTLYEDVRAAIIHSLADAGEVPFAQLADLVEANSPAVHWESASVGWYTTTVKLDLEARGLLARRGNPQVLTLTELGKRAAGRQWGSTGV